MPRYQKIAFLFPGQGAQYPGMAKDFFENFSLLVAKCRVKINRSSILVDRNAIIEAKIIPNMVTP